MNTPRVKASFVFEKNFSMICDYIEGKNPDIFDESFYKNLSLELKKLHNIKVPINMKNVNFESLEKLKTYYKVSINSKYLKEDLNLVELLKTSIGQNIILAISLWFFGTTIIGIPVVFGIVAYRGFCLGYTIAACISIMGISKGIIFVLILLLLQNLLVIPAILALSVSGIKLYKSIMKDKTKENVKPEMLRHTAFSLIMLVVLIISSIIEIFISTNILKFCIKYF